MFRYLGLMFCVVVMAAFASGCGGGGGGTAQMPDATEPDPPVVAPVPGEPTDAEQIAEARQAITTILSNARTRAQAASSVSSSIGRNADAMAAQITNATNNNTAARAALALIESANSAAIAATTPAAAQTALANARAAQSTLNTAASAITSIQSALQTVANARRQRETDERALTNNSSLIQHVRDNKLVSDAVLGCSRQLKQYCRQHLNVGRLARTRIEAADKTESVVPPCAILPGTGTAQPEGLPGVTVKCRALTSNQQDANTHEERYQDP